MQGANECRDYRVAPIKWKHALYSDGMRGKYRYEAIFINILQESLLRVRGQKTLVNKRMQRKLSIWDEYEICKK